MKQPNGMEETIALENAIRVALTGPLSLSDRVAGTAILGSAYRGTGSRLEALREIARRLGK